MSFDADAQDYIDRVVAVDGFMWPHVQAAINRFVTGCKADPSPMPAVSNWDALKACCLMAGPATLEAALVPLKGPAPTKFNFTQNDYHQVLGLKGDGGSKRLGSGYTHSSDPQNNLHAFTFITEPDETGAAGAAYISSQAFTNTSRMLQIQGVGHGFLANGLGGAVPATFGKDGDIGGIGVSRHTSTQIVRHSFGDTSTVNVTSAEPVDQEILIFRRQITGFQSTSARLSFYSLGEAVDLESLDRRVSRYMRDIQMPTRRGFPLSRLVN